MDDDQGRGLVQKLVHSFTPFGSHPIPNGKVVLPDLILGRHGFVQALGPLGHFGDSRSLGLEGLDGQRAHSIQNFPSPDDSIVAGLPVAAGGGETSGFDDLLQFFLLHRPIPVRPVTAPPTEEAEEALGGRNLPWRRSRIEILIALDELEGIGWADRLAMSA